ncbi:MAG: hypothetical protein ACFE9C_08720 [Candidatus Hodarchaeota archaeon]
MGEERGEMTPTKLVLFIAMLFTFAQAIAYFYAAILLPMAVLYGILCLVFVVLIFISLNLIGLGPVKLPYWWWLMLIIGVLMIIFDYLNGGDYFVGTLILIAVLMELKVGDKIKLGGCKFVVFFGILFGIWDCIVIFINFVPGAELYLVNAIFGLIILIILLILVFDLFDIKIPYKCWVVLIIAFVIYTFVQPWAILLNGIGTQYPVVGFGGMILMIGFVCCAWFKE